VAVGSEQFAEAPGTLRAFVEAGGYTWPTASVPSEFMRAFNVTSQSTGIGIAADGTVTFRKGCGAHSEATWVNTLRELAGG